MNQHKYGGKRNDWGGVDAIDAEDEANARLIAAAPDLLAVLKGIAGICCIEHAREEARNAIARARGEG